MTDQPTAREKIANLLWWSIPSHDTDEAKAKAEQMLDDHAAEVRRQHTELATEMLAPQQCPAGLHADWLVDSEYAHACPWCQIESLRTDAAAELLPAWEAVYEPGNVSDYLIGYMNDQDAATGAAEAWMRSQSEVTGRLEWVPWGDVAPMPDGYDRWFELGQRHDDGIDTGAGITVRRRRDPAEDTTPAPSGAPVSALQPPEVPTEPETATEAPEGRVGDGDSGADDAWVPCSPAWLTANPGQCATAPRAHIPEDYAEDISHLHPAVLDEDDVDEMAASLARDGFGADEIAAMLCPGVTLGAHPIADADNPTPLRWGLDDVMWGDDDSVIVLLSGPDREPYWLELDPERAAVLRRNLAGPDSEQPEAIHLHFGLSYCNYLVLPRTFLQSMSDPWQTEFVALLDQLDAAFRHVPQAERYQVEAATEHIVGEMSDAELKRAGITEDWYGEEVPTYLSGASLAEWKAEHEKSEPTYYDRDGNELDRHQRVLIPTADPIPHYDRGRTRIEPAAAGPAGGGR